MATILILNGPNLNLLGTREPEVYGKTTLDDVNNRLLASALGAGHQLVCFQSNAEHELIERIHSAPQQGIDFLIINLPLLYPYQRRPTRRDGSMYRLSRCTSRMCISENPFGTTLISPISH